MDERKDDGSLSFLQIPADPTTKRFNCDTTTQQKLTNRTFWVVDYFKDMHTKFGDDRYLVKLRFNLEDGDDKALKFFTNSKDIKYVLDKIKELDAFPRRVTMRASGARYYFE